MSDTTASPYRQRLRGETALLVSRASIIVAVRAASTILTLVYTVLITRTTSTEGTGLVMAAMSFAFIASVAFSMNVESGSIRFLVKYREAGETGLARGFIAFGRRIVIGVTLAGAALAAAYAGLIRDWQLSSAELSYLLALALCPLLAMTRLQGRHGTALDVVLGSTLPRLLVRPLVFTLILGIAWAMGWQLGPASILALFVLSVLLVAVLQYLAIRRAYEFMDGARPDLTPWRGWLANGARLAPALVLQEYLKNVVIAATALTLAPAAVGLVAVAISITNFLNFSISAVDSSFGPRIARAMNNDDAANRARLLRSALALKLAGMVLGAGLLWLLSDRILLLFGAEYLAAAPLLLIFVAMPMANAIFGPSTMLMNIAGVTGPVFGWTSAGIALMVVLSLAGGVTAGMTGAAAGCALGYVVMYAGLYRACRRHLGIDGSIRSLLLRAAP